MKARLIVVSGTGTGIGKTHFAESLLLALGAMHRRVAGLKPVETGLGGTSISDISRLDRASTFHVKQAGYTFAEPLSPALAARREGRPIRADVIMALVEEIRREADVLVVELPGGLFSPLGDDLLNADLATALSPDVTLLVAPDRLGVLHDVIATTRAAAGVPLRLDGIVLLAPESADPSTGSNAGELARMQKVPVVAVLSRAPIETLAAQPVVGNLAEFLSR